MSTPSISLCLVVKNEELFLRECLESVRPYVDEIVVVDTGSGDRTPAIARELGARVYLEPWPGDLARAHDLPLAHATADWVLTLDGDEALDPAGGAELRALVERAAFDGFIFTVRNYRYTPAHQHRPVDSHDPLVHGARSWSPSHNVRLFRNRPEFRHEGRVHQTVLHAMTRAGATVSTTTIPIHHYGYLRSDRAKSPLYTELAEQQVRDHPGDPKAHLELGLVHLADRRWDAALAGFEHAYALGTQAESSALAGIALHAKQEPRDAVVALLRAAATAASLRFLDEADIWQALGQAYTDLDDDRAAEDSLRRCLRLRPDSPDADGELAALCARNGRLEEAAAIARRLVERYPGLAMSWEVSGYRALCAGAAADAIADFRRALDVEPERPSSLVDLAIAHARHGDDSTAETLLAQAIATDREGRLAAGLGLTRPLGALQASLPTRSRPGDGPELGDRGVMTFIPHLSGGAAFVACELARALAPEHPQIVATFDPGEITGEAHHEALAALGVPVVTVKSAEEMAALQARARPGVVVHHWWHNPVIDALERRGSERLVLRSASPLPMPLGYDRYVTLSAFQEQYQGHIPAAQRERIPNGVDLARVAAAAPREDLWSGFATGGPRGQRPVRIAMLSRLDPDKFVRRLPDYLEPLGDLPIAVAVAGRGGRRWEIEPDLKQRGLAGRVRFLGAIPQRAVAEFLAGADIGLHLTETHQESHSLSVLQMMAAGLPVVAQPRGCLPEMIETGRSGFLALGEREVAAALRLLVEDASLRHRFGAAARVEAELYGADRFAERWRRLIADLLSTRPARRASRA
jgi:glycosyltransferase involved in cell wall biosynthesis/Tfp pilus assembly protein PilF